MTMTTTRHEPRIPAPPANQSTTIEPVTFRVQLCIPEHLARHVPRRRRAPLSLPPGLPVPRQGEVIYLDAGSAWGVQLVVHQWVSPSELRIEVWLDHVSSAQHARPTGFALTQ